MIEARLRDLIALHFDPKGGARYWLKRQRELGIDACREINCVEDLAILGPMQDDALRELPVEDFIPSSLVHSKNDYITAETGGTVGKPKFAVHRRDEFQAAFISPFVAAAQYAEFPAEENWLYVGPSGPHIIAIAARQSAHALNSRDPFFVDFDPRWAKKLPADSFASKRYLQHIEQQALRVVETQQIGVLFSTPPVLKSLAANMSEVKREQIRGLHLGGMSVTPSFYLSLQQLFPNAVLLSGYGNTLFGMAAQLAFDPQEGIDYFPHGTRLLYRIVPLEATDNQQYLQQQVAYGERGRVMAHRLDEAQLIVNMLERDSAVRVAAPADLADKGFVSDGLRDPEALVTMAEKPALGLY